MPPRYVDRAGAAELFAVSVTRIRRYELEGSPVAGRFPAPNGDGLFAVAELKAWRQAQFGTREPPRVNLGEAARELGVTVDEFRRLAAEAKANDGIVDGRRFPAPKGGLNPTYAIAGLRAWKNPRRGLIDVHGVADMVGVNAKTVRDYTTKFYAEDHPDGRAPFFPRPDEVGLWRKKDIAAWLAARDALGPLPRPKAEDGYPCENEKLWPDEDPCPAFLRRRWRFEVSDDRADDVFLCKPHLVKADSEKKAGKR
jgi:hypothetical protein